MNRPSILCAAVLVVSAVLCGPLAAQPADAPAKPVLFLLGEGFNGNEFWQPYFALQAAGHHVVVAGAETGTVKSPYDDRAMDATADVALSDVDPADYLGLVIPGGHSPENLEKHAEAIEICKAFMQAGKPVSGICHGPRLLARAGVLSDRVHTCLWSVKDELPEAWTTGGIGAYVDQPVVVDGNLVTSRYPWDMVPFMRETRRKLAAAAGHAFPPRRPHVVVVDPAPHRLDRWAYVDSLRAAGADVEHLRVWKVPQYVGSDGYDPADSRLLIVLSGRENDKLVADESFRKLLSDFAAAERPVAVIGEVYGALRDAGLVGESVLTPNGPRGDVLRVLLAEAREGMPPPPPPAPPKPATAAVVIGPGFDGRVYAAMRAQLESRGHEVRVVGGRTGWLRGLNGCPAEVEASYDDAKLADDAVLVAPGGLWPEQHSDTDRRVDWLLARHAEGATLVAFGFDSLYIGRREALKSKRFATTAQARWAFQRAGKYTDEPAVVTAERLITAKGFEQVADAVKLLEQASGE
jgi:protease I